MTLFYLIKLKPSEVQKGKKGKCGREERSKEDFFLGAKKNPQSLTEGASKELKKGSLTL